MICRQNRLQQLNAAARRFFSGPPNGAEYISRLARLPGGAAVPRGDKRPPQYISAITGGRGEKNNASRAALCARVARLLGSRRRRSGPRESTSDGIECTLEKSLIACISPALDALGFCQPGPAALSVPARILRRWMCERRRGREGRDAGDRRERGPRN